MATGKSINQQAPCLAPLLCLCCELINKPPRVSGSTGQDTLTVQWCCARGCGGDRGMVGAHACGTDAGSLADSGLSRIAFVSYRIVGKPPMLGRLCSILETAMLAAGALQKRCNICFPGGVHVPLLRNRAHCLTPSAESHSSGQQMLADCPLEAAPEPDRMSHISTSSHRPLFLSAASLSTLFCAPLKGLKREK